MKLQNNEYRCCIKPFTFPSRPGSQESVFYPRFVTFVHQQVAAISRGSSQLVATIVEGIFCMSFYPYKPYVVFRGYRGIFPPEVRVFFTLKAGSHPVAQPAFFNGV